MVFAPSVLAALVLAGGLQFNDVTEQSGLPTARFGGSGAAPMTAGAAWLDWNGDGEVDLLLTGDAVNPMKLFENQGPPEYRFEDVTAEAGLDGLFGEGAVDVFEQGGRLRLIVTHANGAEPAAKLWRQDSPGQAFEPVPLGVMANGAMFPTHGDLDGDGDQDLVLTLGHGCGVGNYAARNVTRLDDIGGVFVPVNNARWPAPGCASVATVADWYNDGRPAVVITSDFGKDHVPAQVIRDDGVHDIIRIDGMGIAVGDVNGDQVSDFLFTNVRDDALMVSEPDGSRRWRSDTYGVGTAWGYEGPRAKWDAVFADLDLDGDLELFVTAGWVAGQTTDTLQKSSLIQDGADVADAAGVGTETVDRTVAMADYNRDGKPDLLVGSYEAWALYRNVTETEGHWLALALPDAPGTQALVMCGGKTWQREWVGGTAGTAHERELHFGLGDCGGPVTVRVRWPWAGETEIGDVMADQRLTIAPPELLTVTPHEGAPGSERTVTYRGAGTEVTLDGVPMSADGAVWMATVGPVAPGEHHAEVVVDGVPLRLRRSFIVTPPVRVVISPNPLRRGLPSTIDIQGSDISGNDIDGKVAASGGTLSDVRTGPWDYRATLRSNTADEVTLTIGEHTITLPVVAAVEPKNTRVLAFMNDKGDIRLHVMPRDGVDLRTLLSGDNSQLRRDGVPVTGGSWSTDINGLSRTVSPGGVLTMEIEGVVLDTAIDTEQLGKGELSPEFSLLFGDMPVIRADGSDRVQLRLRASNARGEPLLTLPASPFEVEGATIVGCDETGEVGWIRSIEADAPVWMVCTRPNNEPGVARFGFAGLEATILKVPAHHVAPVEAHSEFRFDEEAGFLMLIPRDHRQHMVGSGVAIELVTDPPGVPLEYVGDGVYVVLGPVQGAAALLDGHFVVRWGTPVDEPGLLPPDEPGGCCAQHGAPAAPSGMWLVLIALVGLFSRGRRAGGESA